MLALRGRKVEDLEQVRLPDCLEYIFRWFVELDSACRPDGINGLPANAIPPTEIETWARLKVIDLSPFEFDCLLMLDRIKRVVVAKDRSKRQQAKTFKQK